MADPALTPSDPPVMGDPAPGAQPRTLIRFGIHGTDYAAKIWLHPDGTLTWSKVPRLQERTVWQFLTGRKPKPGQR